MKNNEIFKLNNVSKVYGEMRALSSLSLSIKEGELVAIIGPSGAGKTTLLNSLANIVKPEEGEILLHGKPVRSYAEGKKLAQKVGIIRQQFDLVPQLPVIHNVLAGRLKEWGTIKSLISLVIPQDKKLAINALERVGLEDKLYERTSNLSGGQQQRVALARLLVQKPEVILADEPVASLDPARAEDILNILASLVREEKQTLIASLHSVEYALKYFNRVIALKNGEVFFDLPVSGVTKESLSKLYNLKELKEDESKAIF